MAVLIQTELDRLKKSLMTLSAEVESALDQAVQALLNFDQTLADSIISGDDAIDDMEVELEEDCLKVLALHQPVAFDLRFIISVLKINNDVERVADFASSIAQRVRGLAGINKIDSPYDIADMAKKSKEMLRVALDSVMKKDVNLARTAIELDDAVDKIHAENYTRIEEAIVQNSQQTGQLLAYLTISRYFERIGDLSTNIAEDLIYQLEGTIIRHQD